MRERNQKRTGTCRLCWKYFLVCAMDRFAVCTWSVLVLCALAMSIGMWITDVQAADYMWMTHTCAENRVEQEIHIEKIEVGGEGEAGEGQENDRQQRESQQESQRESQQTVTQETETPQVPPQETPEDSLEQFDFSAIEQYLPGSGDSQLQQMSFTEILKELLAGNLMEILRHLFASISTSLFSEIQSSGFLLYQVAMLGIMGAVFTSFSSIFNNSQVSETGFFVTYLLLFTCLASSFFASITVAQGVIGQILEFMRAGMPAYFLAVAWSGASVSAVALYEAVLFLIASVEWLFLHILLPVVRIYILLVLAGHISKEEVLTRLTELLRQFITWSVRALAGVVLGVHLIQGMVLPYVDSVKHGGLQRLVEIIPGIGQGASVAAQLVLGSGVLIKNTMGAAFVLILAAMVVIPFLKLFILMILYQCVSAVLQPICDKRVVSCIADVAEGQKMLLQMVAWTLLLFVISIAMICGSTNTVYLS